MTARLPGVLLAATALLLALGGRMAVAYWTSPGAGSGASNAGAVQAVTVLAATGSPASSLIPGGTADLRLTVDNPNSVSVRIVGVAPSGGTVTVLGGTGCTPSNAGVSVPTTSGLDVAVAAGGSVGVNLPGAVAMTAATPNGCQGASFQIPVTVTVQR